MKKKVLSLIVFVVIMLLINPLVSAFSVTREEKKIINDKEKEASSDNEEPSNLIWAIINVYVYYWDGEAHMNKICPNATVWCWLWVPGFYLFGVIIFELIIKEMLLLYPKKTDENGMCTYIRPYFLPWIFSANKDNMKGMCENVDIHPGECTLYIYIKQSEN